MMELDERIQMIERNIKRLGWNSSRLDLDQHVYHYWDTTKNCIMVRIDATGAYITDSGVMAMSI